MHWMGKWRGLLYCAACLLLCLSGMSSVFAESNSTRSAPKTLPELGIHEFIIKFSSTREQGRILPADALGLLSTAAGRQFSFVRRMSGGAHVVSVPDKLSLGEATALGERLSALPGVEYVSPNRRFFPKLAPNDPRFDEQWHYADPDQQPGTYGASLPEAWDLTTGDAGVVVAVIDTGLLPHVDIDGNILDGSGRVLPGYDFISDSFVANDGGGRDANPTDPGDAMGAGECGDGFPPVPQPSSWHGTHVMGTVGALTDNAAGVAGVDWEASLLPVRALGKCGGDASDVIDAMRWAAGLSVAGVPDNPNPAKVLNLSLGGAGDCLAAEQTAINEIVAAGVTIVTAAGNEAMPASGSTPGNCNGVINVHATRRDGGFAGYSNFGPEIAISAPGGWMEFSSTDGVLSTLDSGLDGPANDNAFAFYQGTSMAAPHVSGIAALMLSRDANLTPAEIRGFMQTTARAFPIVPSAQCNTSECGAGIINAAAAVAAVTPATPDTEPDAFSFVDINNVVPDDVVTSEPVTITGINTPAPISVTNGLYSIGCSASFTADPGLISNNDAVCVRHTASDQFGMTVSTTLNIGGITDEFSSTTLSGPSTTPNAFVFVDQSGVRRGATVTSNRVTIRGITEEVPISVAGGEYSIGCSSGFTAADGMIDHGQAVCVRHIAADEFSTATDTELTVGGVSDIFTSTTVERDINPDVFSFIAVVDVEPDTQVTSNLVTISGINDASPVSVIDGEYSIGCQGQGFTSEEGNITAGQSVCVRHRSSTQSGGIVTSTLSVGSFSTDFSSKVVEAVTSPSSDDDDDEPIGGNGGIGGSGSGRGCVMGASADFDPLLLLLILTAARYVVSRKQIRR